MGSFWTDYRYKIWAGIGVCAVTASAATMFLNGLPLVKAETYMNTQLEMAERTIERTQAEAPTDLYLESLEVEYGTSSPGISVSVLNKTADSLSYKDVIRRGSLAIPLLNLSVPIYEGSNDAVLSLGAGTVKPGQKLGRGNFAVTSNNFSHIDRLSENGLSAIQPDLVTENLKNEAYRKELVTEWFSLYDDSTLYASVDDWLYTYKIVRTEILPATANYVASDKRVEAFDPKTKKSLFTIVLPIAQADETADKYVAVITSSYVKKSLLTEKTKKYFKEVGY